MDKKLEKIIDLKLDASDRDAERHGLIQYNYGQILRIHGLDLPPAAEIQFSYREKGGVTENRVGTTKDGITEVQIPDAMLKNNGTTQDYAIWVFVYVVDETSGNTVYRIKLYVDSRPAPGEIGEDPDEPHPFDEAVNAVNAAADRAEQAEQNAKASAIEAGKYAASASESATAAEKNKEDALREVGEKKQEAIKAIQEQEETSVGKITTHTDDEIQRILNQTAEPKRELEQTITNADAFKGELDHSIETAGTSKTALDKSVGLAGTAKIELDTSTQKAGEAKTALDGSAKTAGEMQETLSATVKQAGTLDTSLGEKIETGTQLKTDLTVSGEKAVQDIQAAGSEQLGKMQAVAEEFTADREQIATNKEDIGSLKEDLEEVKDKKITKFYASNQGETHLADSDSGKIVDMSIYGKSEQFTTTGKNLLPFPYTDKTKTENGVTFDVKDDGKIHIYGTATETTYFNLSNNIEWGNETFWTKNERYKLIGGLYYNARNKILSYDVKKGETLDKILAPMVISINETNSTYEPYTGGIPSPSPDYPQEIKSVVNPVVKVCGKNLYNARAYPLIEKGYNGLTIQKKDDYYTIVGTATEETVLWLCGSYSNRTPLFTLKKGNYALTSSLTIYSSTGDVRKKVTGIFSIDEDYPVTGICVAYQKGDVLNNKLYVQIEKGSEATSYEPHTEQSVQLPYTLNAIPVASGGNVTIDGQQYIADYVDVEKGKLYRKVKRLYLKDIDNTAIAHGFHSNGNGYLAIKVENAAKNGHCISNKYKYAIWTSSSGYLYIPNDFNVVIVDDSFTDKQTAIGLIQDVYLFYELKSPIEDGLSTEQIKSLKSLSTYHPVTNITVGSEELDGYAVFNYPVSMVNGWNYVKQQLNDNRDYIYNIDTQAAEAYVNSEYAVALTELEA